MNLYMHTIDGEAGEFRPREKDIVFVGRVCKRFAPSLQQVRREQEIARRTDSQDRVEFRYDYVRLQLSEETDHD